MIQIKAFAKINWSLDILGRRGDGYHEMDMIMQHISLWDDVQIEAAEDLSLAGHTESASQRDARDGLSSAAVRFDESNLMFRAARLLQTECNIHTGARMTLVKRIPSGAGLGGGSADAAAVLEGLNQLWGLGLPHEELLRLGLKLGADVPYMLTPGPARVQGIGEKLKPLQFPEKAYLVLVQPCGGLSTGEIFSAYDGQKVEKQPRPNLDELEGALCSGRLSEATRHMGNVLQPICESARPAITRCVSLLKEGGALTALMTGSGSVVYGVFENEAAQQAAFSQTLRLAAEYGFGGVYAASTLP